MILRMAIVLLRLERRHARKAAQHQQARSARDERRQCAEWRTWRRTNHAVVRARRERDHPIAARSCLTPRGRRGLCGCSCRRLCCTFVCFLYNKVQLRCCRQPHIVDRRTKSSRTPDDAFYEILAVWTCVSSNNNNTRS